MFDRAIVHLICLLIKREIILAKDKEIYYFGIRTMFIQMLHMILIIIMGAFLGLIMESILFLFGYMSLRVNAGGYHAPDNKRCFLLTIAIDIVVLSILKYFPLQYVLLFLMVDLLVIVPLIIWYAPIENEKKTLDVLEKKVYRRRSRYILIGIVIWITCAYLLGKTSAALVLGLSIFIEGSMMLISLIQNKNIIVNR